MLGKIYYVTSFAYKKRLRSTFFLYLAQIANSKTGVGFHEIFQSVKGFHKPDDYLNKSRPVFQHPLPYIHLEA
jgi:hypothetical protein